MKRAKKDKKEPKKARAKTGNCWNGRHHTCKGWGRKRTGESGKISIYVCNCSCHDDKFRERAIADAKKWETMQAVR